MGNRPDCWRSASVPIWAFHGELDDIVDPQGSIEPMTELAACPGVTADRAKLTVYPGPVPRRLGSGLQRIPRRRHLHLDARLQQAVTAPLAGRQRTQPTLKRSLTARYRLALCAFLPAAGNGGVGLACRSL